MAGLRPDEAAGRGVPAPRRLGPAPPGMQPPHRRRAAAIRAVLAAAIVVLAPPAPASAASAPFRACADTNFECTRVSVPLDRSGRVRGGVSLYVERARRRGRGAVFALAGGPGQGATSLTENFHSDLFSVLGGRDLIVFDQRGTGRSGALNCPELELTRPSARPLDQRVESCAARLGPQRAFYTTRDSVEDIEAVRRRVGAARITLYGVSYGTKVALAYAARYPRRVERLLLDSVVELEGQNPFDLDTFRAMPRVLDEICRGECAGVTRSLSSDVATLVDRMRSTPLRGPFVDRQGRRRTVEITRRQLYDRIRSGDFDPDARAEYPSAIRSALDGDPAPLLRLEHRYDGLEPDEPIEPQVQSLSFTLHTATLCEEAPLPWERTAPPAERMRQARERAEAIPDSAFEPFDRETSLASEDDILHGCVRWPTTPEPPALASGPLPDVPVLILEGAEDLRTPVEAGARLATRFRRAKLATVPKTAHSVLGRGAPCAEVLLRRFFSDSPLGAPCRGARRAKRVEPLAPARLEQVRPARGSTGLPGRTLAAVLLTIGDLYSEYDQIAFLLPRPAGGGLRGGRFWERSGAIRLERFSFVPGVHLTGRLSSSGRGAGALTVGGAGAAPGSLSIDREGTLSGRLGGQRVRARLRN